MPGTRDDVPEQVANDLLVFNDEHPAARVIPSSSIEMRVSDFRWQG
jgi:hypothetical protein